MNIIDIGIVLVLIMFAIAGWKKGVIKETVSVVGLIVVFIIAYTFKEQLGNILCKYLPGPLLFYVPLYVLHDTEYKLSLFWQIHGQ